ncbi:MAG: DUF1598 domain-containing protein [Planctomycetota bacterium]|nr:DUF1598 domain-containing protein [Planctomycetota bacterium]
MLKTFGTRSKAFKGLATIVVLAVALHPSFGLIPGGNNGGGGFFGNQVGGVAVDANGIVNLAPVKMLKSQAELLRKRIKPGNSDLREPTKMRMVSLKGLEKAVKKYSTDGQPGLPDEVRYLAGLQRIEYVFLYPEQNDIVIAGPGEGWKVDDYGRVVGEHSGHPVMHLDDLIVALRTVHNARQGDGISVSIDPTSAGVKAFQSVMRKQRRFNENLLPQLEQAMGNQVISLTGIPENSHFARVLVAADYKMKSIAMNLTQSDVDGLVSFPVMLKKKGANPRGQTMPRWWMACNYEPLAKSQDGLTWKVRGQGVKTMTEDDVFENGGFKGTGRANKFAQEWANLMTEKFGELALEDPVFGDLRNIMDMSVVAALVEKEGMLKRVGLKIPTLSSSDSDYEVYQLVVPKKLPTKASVLRIGNNYMITASGGVQVESWQVAANNQIDNQIAVYREKSNPDDYLNWWWN